MENSKGGYFLVYRKAYDHKILNDTRPETRRGAWLDLIAGASWEEHKTITIKGREYHLTRGQQARSKETLRKAWGWGKATVDRFLKQLEAEGMISMRSDAITTIITITNYDKHQSPQTASQLSSQQTSQQSGQPASQVSSQPASQLSTDEKPRQQRGSAVIHKDGEPTIEPSDEPTIEPAIEPTIEPAGEVQLKNLKNLNTTPTQKTRGDFVASLPDPVPCSAWEPSKDTIKLIKMLAAPDDFIQLELCEFKLYRSEQFFQPNEWNAKFLKQVARNWRREQPNWSATNDKHQQRNQQGPVTKLSTVGQATRNGIERARELEREIAEEEARAGNEQSLDAAYE